MAIRPVFVVSLDSQYCIRENIEFEYFNGFSDQQKKRCIRSLHQAYQKKHPEKRVLEISSKSEEELGIKLSAFQLMATLQNGKKCSVESAFQASKTFENGGPYLDLLEVSPKAAKKEERLKNSGKLLSFSFDGQIFPIEPKTYFYHWLYIHALHTYPKLTEALIHYDAFTDIVFNPQKSINCQAEAAAIYVSLQKQGLLQDALKDRETFLKIVYHLSS